MDMGSVVLTVHIFAPVSKAGQELLAKKELAQLERLGLD